MAIANENKELYHGIRTLWALWFLVMLVADWCGGGPLPKTIGGEPLVWAVLWDQV